MAARGAFYRSCRFGFLLQLILQDCPQGVRRTKAKRSVSYLNSLFIRNLCGLTVINRVNTTSTSLESKTTTRIGHSTGKKLNDLKKIRKLCENQRLSDARVLLDSFLKNSWAEENLTRTFNCLLYHAVRDKDDDIVDYVKEKMKKYNIRRDSASYYILTLYYSELGLLDQGIELLREMQADGFETSSRNYIPIIESSARAGKLETAFNLYEEMMQKNLAGDRCYPALIGGVIKKNDCATWDEKVLEMLHTFRAERQELNIETLETIAKWFKRQTRNQWQISWTTVNSRGACQSCGITLESGALTEREHSVLEQYLTQHLWESIKGRTIKAYTTVGNFVDEHCHENKDCLPQSLNEYISKTGPYDIVLDALNVGYYCGKGNFDTIKLQETAKNFLNDGKKLLIVGAPPLSLTPLKHAADMNSLADNKSSRCGVFLMSGRWILDDIYMLLAAVHCGINTLLVSNDLFQDHLQKLPISIQILLKRWLRTNQVFVTRSIEDKRVVFKTHPSYDPIVQTTENTWHLPSNTNDTWLCVQEK